MTNDRGFLPKARREDLDEGLQLGMCIGFGIGWQRFNQAFGILPDSWRDGSALPWEQSVRAGPA